MRIKLLNGTSKSFNVQPTCSFCIFPSLYCICIERALYCFECNFHILFNMAHGNCRLNYSIAENRLVQNCVELYSTWEKDLLHKLKS